MYIPFNIQNCNFFYQIPLIITLLSSAVARLYAQTNVPNELGTFFGWVIYIEFIVALNSKVSTLPLWTPVGLIKINHPGMWAFWHFVAVASVPFPLALATPLPPPYCLFSQVDLLGPNVIFFCKQSKIVFSFPILIHPQLICAFAISFPLLS
jgi:hypothetical protein